MNATRKNKDGAITADEPEMSSKPRNGIGIRFVQRKFAQGVPIPPTQQVTAPPPTPERRPEPPREDQRMVYHSRMSAMNLLDVIALQKVHPHQQPKVLLERLRENEMPGPAAPPSPAVPAAPPAPSAPSAPSAPAAPAASGPTLRRHDTKRVTRNIKFKKKMCLRPRVRPTTYTQRPTPSTSKPMDTDHAGPSKARPELVRDDTSVTEDDLPLLYLKKEPASEDVDMTDSDSLFEFDFKRPAFPGTYKTIKIRRRTREVTPKPWLLKALDLGSGQPRRSGRRPCPRAFSVASQRPARRRVYWLPPSRLSSTDENSFLEPVGEVSVEDMNDPYVTIVNCLDPSCCAAAPYRSVRHVVSASTSNSGLLSRRCLKCRRCDVIKKIIQLSGLIVIAYQNREPLTEFKIDGEVVVTKPLAHLRGLPRGAIGLESPRSPFLDIFPKTHDIVIKFEPILTSDDTMDIAVYIVDRASANTSDAPSFMDQKDIISILLEFVEKQLEGRGLLDDQEVRDNLRMQAEQGLPPHVNPHVQGGHLGTEEPKPSTSHDNVEPERKPEPKRKRTVTNKSQPAKAQENVETGRKPIPKRKRSEGSILAGEVPRHLRVSVDRERPGSSCSEQRFRNNTRPKRKTRAKSKPKTDKEKAKEKARKKALREAVPGPTFCPTTEEFRDPIAFIKKLEPDAANYGFCKIMPPKSFKPPCKMVGTSRFKVVYQYVSKLFNRWGSNARELAAIKAYLWLQKLTVKKPPILECSEINLPKLHHAVERYGGADNVLKCKRWSRVAEDMHLHNAKTRERQLDEVFIQYLLPYASLSLEERQKKITSVENGWTKKYQRTMRKANRPFQKQERLLGEGESSEEETELPEVAAALEDAEECIVPGRIMNLNVFKKIADNMKLKYFEGIKSPCLVKIENEYWNAVMQGNEDMVANSASISTKEEGFGFPRNESNGYSMHPYNLKRVANHSDNVLRFLGHTSGASYTKLHLNMMFSSTCWNRDPQNLPFIEYMHKGAPKIWYAVPECENENFRRAVERLCPSFCQNKPLWLASDVAMIPPEILHLHSVKLTRLVQTPGEFVVIYPKTYYCSVSTGFSVTESVYFATLDWLESAPALFKNLRDCCEPSMFSLEKLLLNGTSDPDTPRHLLLPMCSALSTIISNELENRRVLALKGLNIDEQLPPKRGSSRRAWNSKLQCEYCRCTLHLSGVVGLTEKRSALCPEHAIKLLECKKYSDVSVPDLEFRTNFKNADLEQIIKNMEARVVSGV